MSSQSGIIFDIALDAMALITARRFCFRWTRCVSEGSVELTITDHLSWIVLLKHVEIKAMLMDCNANGLKNAFAVTVGIGLE